MSRTVANIDQSIITAIQADPVLGPLLTSASDTAIWRLWSYIIAVSQSTEEQLYDNLLVELENLISDAAPSTANWVQNQALNFQYSSSVPQLIELDPITFAPRWQTIDTALRIVSRCAVVLGGLGQVNVKVATGTTPSALTSPQLNALQAFLTAIEPAGIRYNAISINADKICSKVTVYYNGVYSAVIQANLLTAYTNLLANIPFNGNLKVSQIETALLNVNGVSDVIINEIGARADTTSFSSRTYLVSSNTEIIKEWNSAAGYCTDETTTGYHFTDLLTLISI